MKRATKTVIACVAGLILLVAVYFLWQLLLSPLQLAVAVTREFTRREHQLLYDIDQVALAAELRKFAEEYRWSIAFADSRPAVFWPNDPAIPPPLKILQPTSILIFNDRIMFERGGPPHHFGLVVFRDTSTARSSEDESVAGVKLLKEFQPGVWFYSDYRKVPPP